MDGILKNTDLSAICEQIYDEIVLENNDKYDYLEAKFTEFFILAKRIFANVDISAAFDIEMEKIKTLIDDKVFEGISLAEISHLAGLCESTFSRRFQKYFGVSFKRYVMIKKIEKAVSLLKIPDSKVTDVAFECGFNSISGFYDTFKKITGTTPEKMTETI